MKSRLVPTPIPGRTPLRTRLFAARAGFPPQSLLQAGHRYAWLCCGIVLLSGCSCWNGVRSQSPDSEEARQSRPRPQLVGDMAVPFGMYPVQVEAVGLVTGLNGTGSDPAPSPQRNLLISEMKARGVDKPNTILRSKDTAMVVVRGVLRAGIRKGDRFDIEVRIPSRSETTSLRGGHLLPTRLRELAVLENQIHKGHALGIAEGPILVDPSATDQKDRIRLGRGMVLGGGICLKSRPMMLVLKPDHQNVVNSARIATAVNRRFHTFDRGIKVGVANAQTDKLVDLKIHPRYQNNIERYVNVVRAVALRENTAERAERLEELGHRLLDPVTASQAALELESMGVEGVDVLLEGLKGPTIETRFFAAEALAYLERSEAAKTLGEAARNEPAFRVFALAALSTLGDFHAYDELRDLLSVSSAETRYGAFRSLWLMNPHEPLVMGERLGGEFSYHVLDTSGPAMVHLTHSRRPELVLFGREQRFQTPLAVNAGTQIMITATGPDEVSIARFATNKPDERRVVSSKLDDVVRAIVELGGTYPDVVQALQEAKAAGALTSHLAVDSLPKGGRTFNRSGDGEAAAQSDDPGDETEPQDASDTSLSGGSSESGSESPESPHPKRGFLARIMGRD